MSKIKMLAGVCLLLQAFTFLVMLFLSGVDKRKKAAVLGLLATGAGIVGTYLFLKGAKDYTPSVKCCCSDNEEDFGFEMEDVDDIDCNFLTNDDVIEDVED